MKNYIVSLVVIVFYFKIFLITKQTVNKIKKSVFIATLYSIIKMIINKNVYS